MSFEAFKLLSLPRATLNTADQSYSGQLELKCVSLVVETDKGMQGEYPPSHQELYLVLRVNGFDTPIDPSQSICFSSGLAGRSYVFGTADGSAATLLLPNPPPSATLVIEDQDAFHGILAQYANLQESSPTRAGKVADETVSHEAARGRLVLVDDNTGEVVGELDHRLQIKEDPKLSLQGAESDPVVIEIPDEDAQEVFARVIPPEERNWITNSASFVSQIISGTTKLVLTTITSASDYYIAHSRPHSSVPSTNSNTGPTPAPQRVLMFLTSESTVKGLSTVHALSAQAASVSDLILAAMDSSVKQIVSVGGDNLARAVEHSYGAEAARAAGFVTGTTNNIVAVYIDMRGIGRRAIIKRVGREFVKGRLSSRPR
ncbi:hypothetical protein ID866_6799 [Astraeus odoratus]|nr:hypothetical protein ID866_6799 [Astraeus odoratus]